MADNTLYKYDQDFAHAMALKLRLNRESRSRRADLIKRHGEFRLVIVEQTCKDRPGLRLEKTLEMREAFGFQALHKHRSRLARLRYSGLFLTLEFKPLPSFI